MVGRGNTQGSGGCFDVFGRSKSQTFDAADAAPTRLPFEIVGRFNLFIVGARAAIYATLAPARIAVG
jgi:hypothetical protein